MARDHILAEPAARNTAACIGYAAMEILKKYGDGIMCVFPSDHFVKNQEEFTRILGLAVEAAEREDKLITLGITPTFPSTGYGYIRFDRSAPGVAKQVLEFKEKPDEETAKRYLASGEYSGTAACLSGRPPQFWRSSKSCFRRFTPVWKRSAMP